MVVRTLVKLARTTVPKQSGAFPGIKPDYHLPALKWVEMKHHYAVRIFSFNHNIFIVNTMGGVLL